MKTDVVFINHDNNMVSLQAVLNALETFCNKDKHYQEIFSAEPGRKYIKIIQSFAGSRSVYAFIDFDGNIYKAASWKAPAKHIRGSVFDKNYSIEKAFGKYGVVYLR